MSLLEFRALCVFLVFALLFYTTEFFAMCHVICRQLFNEVYTCESRIVCRPECMR